MPGVARFQDICTGHSCWPSRPNNQASPDTFCNNRGVHRQSDSWEVHCWGPPCHGGSLASGSSTVYVNNLQCGRCGDPVDCGSSVQSCSEDTFAGD